MYTQTLTELKRFFRKGFSTCAQTCSLFLNQIFYIAIYISIYIYRYIYTQNNSFYFELNSKKLNRLLKGTATTQGEI